MAGNTPSNVFGPVEHADDTRQAQHQIANDAVVDVNMNAILARRQGQTTANAGDEFAAAAARRTIIADKLLDK